jgi:parallel beta-helix repeat protein
MLPLGCERRNPGSTTAMPLSIPGVLRDDPVSTTAPSGFVATQPMNSEEGRGGGKKGDCGGHTFRASRGRRHAIPGVIVVCLMMIVAVSLVLALTPGARAWPSHGATLKVPSQYPTIQSAINAAHPGDTILVAPGTYTEQLLVTTSITLVGSGPGRTIIQNPAAGSDQATLEITNGAVVALSGFTIISTGAFGIGVAVTGGSSALITSDTVEALGANGFGVVVDDGAFATVTWNEIVATTTPTDGYEIGVFLNDAQATISHNVIEGPGGFGVWLYADSSATISYNLITEFECGYNASSAAAGLCGPNYATQFQGSGIADSGDAGLGTTISNNVVSSTDVGIVLSGGCPGCVVKNNLVVGSVDFGLSGIDGTYTFAQTAVIGGTYAVASIGFSVDTTVTLSHVLMVGQTVPSPSYYYEDACFEVFGYTCTETIGGS